MNAFKQVFDTLFFWFDSAIDVFTEYSDIIVSPIGDLLNDTRLPDWLISFLSMALDTLNINDYSILSFVLGVGVPIYIASAVIKYFVEAF